MNYKRHNQGDRARRRRKTFGWSSGKLETITKVLKKEWNYIRTGVMKK